MTAPVAGNRATRRAAVRAMRRRGAGWTKRRPAESQAQRVAKAVGFERMLAVADGLKKGRFPLRRSA